MFCKSGSAGDVCLPGANRLVRQQDAHDDRWPWHDLGMILRTSSICCYDLYPHMHYDRWPGSTHSQHSREIARTGGRETSFRCTPLPDDAALRVLPVRSSVRLSSVPPRLLKAYASKATQTNCPELNWISTLCEMNFNELHWHQFSTIYFYCLI